MAAVNLTPDSSGNGYDGALIGSAAVVASATGFGSGVSFSGTNNAEDTDCVWVGPGNVYGSNGTGWSLEFRVKRTRSGVQEKLVTQWAATAGSCSFLPYFDSSNKLNLAFYDSGGGLHFVPASSTAVADTNWHSAQFSHDGTTVRTLLDGALVASLSFSGAWQTSVQDTPFRLGRGETTTDAFSGVIDEVRVSKVARNTSAYTPATSPFVSDANTVLLLHCDSAAPTTRVMVRAQNTPVLAKGGTYNSIFVDALAAPAACWDGTRFVQQVSAYNLANRQWYTLYFTSPDLKTWTYVANSIRPPTGSDYLFGNGGIAWFAGKYWTANNHYPALSSATGVRIDWSTDLLTWTNTLDGGLDSYGADPSLVVNPNSGKLECWFIDNNLRVRYAESSDGSAWTVKGLALVLPFNRTNAGEPQVAYDATGGQYLTMDGATVSAFRSTQGFAGKASARTFAPIGEILAADPSGTWETGQVFDCAVVGYFDVGDGHGTQLWMLYAGTNTHSATDNTDSSIGLTFLPTLGFVPAGATALVGSGILC